MSEMKWFFCAGVIQVVEYLRLTLIPVPLSPIDLECWHRYVRIYALHGYSCRIGLDEPISSPYWFSSLLTVSWVGALRSSISDEDPRKVHPK